MPLSQIYYFFDPMCGWCYGFTPVLDVILKHYPEIPLEIICGGMVPEHSEGPIGVKGQYISGAIPRVESYTGIKFGELYRKAVEDGSIWNASFKPSVAVTIMKQLFPERTLELVKRLQKAHFFDGQSLNEDHVYPPILAEMGFDPEPFLTAMAEADWQQQTRREFSFTSDVGISGFPTLVGQRNKELFMITNGYCTPEALLGIMQEIADPAEV